MSLRASSTRILSQEERNSLLARCRQLRSNDESSEVSEEIFAEIEEMAKSVKEEE